MLELLQEMLEYEDVEIVGPEGSWTVPAMMHPSVPGLAVVEVAFGVFNVTHVSTGMRMCAGWERAHSAFLVLSQYALIAQEFGFSWDEYTAEDAMQFYERFGAQPVPFDGSSMTVEMWVRLMRDAPGGVHDEQPWGEDCRFTMALQNLEKVFRANDQSVGGGSDPASCERNEGCGCVDIAKTTLDEHKGA